MITIVLEIPDEFKHHYDNDKFTDSLERVAADLKSIFHSAEYHASGRYEIETVDMLIKAFKESEKTGDNLIVMYR